MEKARKALEDVSFCLIYEKIAAHFAFLTYLHHSLMPFERKCLVN